MDNKRLFLAALLSVAVLILWQSIFPAQPPVPRPAQELPAGVDTPRTGLAEPDIFETSVADSAPRTGPEGVFEPSEASTQAPVEISAQSEQKAVLETDEFRAVFTNRGGQLVSWRSKKHGTGDGAGVDLVKRREGYPYPFALSGDRGAVDAEGLNEALFEVSELPGGGIRFEYSGPAGQARKSFELLPNGLMGVTIELPGRPGGWAVLLGPGVRNAGSDELEGRFARRAVVYSQAGEVERLDAARTDEEELLSGNGLDWVGVEDTYFLSGWITEDPLSSVRVRPVFGRLEGAEGEGVFRPLSVQPEDDDGVVRELEVLLEAGGEKLRGATFFGAKQYDRLAQLPKNLEGAVDLGFFAILARPLLFGLGWLHDQVTSNYGWAIILMTFLIRIALFPLTHKSFVSMQKMQEVNPKIQAIRTKYRPKLKDKQGRPNAEMQRKMNEEVMALYKTEGVNPAGGCLPMLVQLPVLFAFYSLLLAAVELRHAPWMLWIQDLSAPDPYYVLPIIMGGSQFVQQRITPTAADPMQRRIFMLMPFFFTILFLGFPSGMVLYWLTNNVLGIGQQVAYKKYKESRQEAEKAGATKSRKATKGGKASKTKESRK